MIGATSGVGTAYPSEVPDFTPGFYWGRVARSLVLCVCFVDRCLSFCTFSFGHCVVCSFTIYEFWLPFWYLQTLLTRLLMNIGTKVLLNTRFRSGLKVTYIVLWYACTKYNISGHFSRHHITIRIRHTSVSHITLIESTRTKHIPLKWS